MKALDRLLQRWRIGKAAPFIEEDARVLDVGCSRGELFIQYGDRIGSGLGIDDDLETPLKTDRYELIRGSFPETLNGETRERFSVITMLAVLEHIPEDRQAIVARGCAEHLKPGGYLVVTTPAPAVDHILDGLKFLRLIDGMSLHEHYGFQPRDTPEIFTGHGLTLVEASTFQLGLNHLFVFQKPPL